MSGNGRENVRSGVIYGVYRSGTSLPDGFLGELDGRWFDIDQIVDFVGDAHVSFANRYEARDGDNERAAVFLVWLP